MIRRAGITIIAILLLASLCVVSIGCSKSSSIVGKWQDNQTNNMTSTTEFIKGGNFTAIFPGQIITGTYQLIGGDVVKLVPDGHADQTASLQYTISGDVMHVTTGGVNMTWTRISK